MLENKTKELVDGVKELVDESISLGGARSIKGMDAAQLKQMQTALELLDKAYDLVIGQSKALDEINGKLDTVLAKLKD